MDLFPQRQGQAVQDGVIEGRRASTSEFEGRISLQEAPFTIFFNSHGPNMHGCDASTVHYHSPVLHRLGHSSSPGPPAQVCTKRLSVAPFAAPRDHNFSLNHPTHLTLLPVTFVCFQRPTFDRMKQFHRIQDLSKISQFRAIRYSSF